MGVSLYVKRLCDSCFENGYDYECDDCGIVKHEMRSGMRLLNFWNICIAGAIRYLQKKDPQVAAALMKWLFIIKNRWSSTETRTPVTEKDLDKKSSDCDVLERRFIDIDQVQKDLQSEEDTKDSRKEKDSWVKGKLTELGLKGLLVFSDDSLSYYNYEQCKDINATLRLISGSFDSEFEAGVHKTLWDMVNFVRFDRAVAGQRGIMTWW